MKRQGWAYKLEERRVRSGAWMAMIVGAVIALCTPSVALASPSVVSTSFTNVTTHSVSLKAEINPGGKVVSYRFEYGSSDCAINTCSTNPSLEGIITSKATTPETTPLVELDGLTPATTYHFRVVVRNASNEIASGDDTLLATLPEATVASACANDGFRIQKPSGLLPDCRAYEQASPPNKNGADVNGAPNEVQASADGNAVAYFTAAGLPGAVGAQDFETFVSRRDPNEWFTHGAYPPSSEGPVARNAGWTPNFSLFFSNVANSFDGPWAFIARSSHDNSLLPISLGANKEGFLVGASSDGSLIYFQSEALLTPEAAPGKNNFYVWNKATESISLAGILPDSACGSPPCIPPGGSFGGPYEWFSTASADSAFYGNRDHKYYLQSEHVVSEDGFRAYFTAAGGQIYLREGAAEAVPKTVHVSASQKTNGGGSGGSDANGTRPAAFMTATPDGSSGFFTSAEKLTNDAATGPEPAIPSIARASISGEPVSFNLNFLPERATGLAVDSQYIYWANPSAGTIGRAKLGSGGPEQIESNFITGVGKPQWVTLNSEYIYWTSGTEGNSANEGKIGRAGIDGDPQSVNPSFIPSRVEISPGVFKSIVSNPQGISVDDNYIYWSNGGTNAIARAQNTGENPEPDWHYLGGTEIPQGIAVNSKFIYWTTNNPNSFISRADLDGSNEVFKSVNLPGFVPSEVRGIAIDTAHVYWVRKAGSDIGRANLDLGEIEEGFVSTEGTVKALAVDAENIYWSVNGDAVPNPGNDLYQFDAETGELSDLTVDTKDPNGAEVKGVLGASSDGSYVYFAANGDLDGAGPAEAGDCEAGTSGGGFLNGSGHCSIYLVHSGDIHFVARLDAGGGESDAANWEPQGQVTRRPSFEKASRVSTDGKTLVFRSQEQLTEYDNQSTAEFYRFTPDEGVMCVSCPPTYAAPVGAPSLQSITPALPVVEPQYAAAILTRNLSADGKRIFFESSDQLVAADINGSDGCPREGQGAPPACQDVYEWEAKGSGSCESSTQNGGCLYLLSSGTSAEPAFFADASESGNDAFIFTRSALVPQDQDNLQDAYDARVEGGLASQNVVPPPSCEGDACKPGASAPPPFQSPQTPGFQGPANPKEKSCPKGKRKVTQKGKSRCVAKKRKKHKGTSKKKGKQKAKKSGRVGR